MVEGELAGNAVVVLNLPQELHDALGGGAVFLHAFQDHASGIIMEGGEHDVVRVVILLDQLFVILLEGRILGGVVVFVILAADDVAFRGRTRQLDVDRVHVAVDPQDLLVHAQLPGLGRGRGGFGGVAGDKQKIRVGLP